MVTPALPVACSLIGTYMPHPTKQDHLVAGEIESREEAPKDSDSSLENADHTSVIEGKLVSYPVSGMVDEATKQGTRFGGFCSPFWSLIRTSLYHITLHFLFLALGQACFRKTTPVCIRITRLEEHISCTVDKMR